MPAGMRSSWKDSKSSTIYAGTNRMPLRTSSTRYFTASHETLIWARRKGAPGHVFNYEKMKHGEWDGDPLKVPGKQMRSVWSIPSPRRNEKGPGRHPTQKTPGSSSEGSF